MRAAVDLNDQGVFSDLDEMIAWVMAHRPAATCQHCGRTIIHVEVDGWVDPEAPSSPEEGDDFMWRSTCDAHDTFTAEHEPS